MSKVKSSELVRAIVILVLRVALVVSLIGGGWLIYKRLPPGHSKVNANNGATQLQIVVRQSTETPNDALDVTVDFYPVDIVAVRHEYFTEPRAGKRFEDF